MSDDDTPDWVDQVLDDFGRIIEELFQTVFVDLPREVAEVLLLWLFWTALTTVPAVVACLFVDPRYMLYALAGAVGLSVQCTAYTLKPWMRLRGGDDRLADSRPADPDNALGDKATGG